MERAALESAFALIREAGEWLRAGRELGFGALADPQSWLERIEGPGMARAKVFFIGGTGCFAWRFSRCACGDPAVRAAKR